MLQAETGQALMLQSACGQLASEELWFIVRAQPVWALQDLVSVYIAGWYFAVGGDSRKKQGIVEEKLMVTTTV